ncbi:hypothetical protein LV89_04224 [Arcicella aurantiaca]|uniref:Natural product n=1 Tax=Arcicella aurantiaca TaxID=591202 RepID=A0A316DMX1_9BACT|nr:class I lanthipeptide [Arcicella aurantiaca]PWK18073.1 hypothetical protein LV89_04224 [Arcicella aurantiaca]
MKKQVKIAQNLSLDKETIAKLDESQLKDVAGGGSLSCNNAAAVAEDSTDDSELTDIHSCCNASCNG